jgi:hypothetical protein
MRRIEWLQNAFVKATMILGKFGSNGRDCLARADDHHHFGNKHPNPECGLVHFQIQCHLHQLQIPMSGKKKKIIYKKVI